VSLKCFIIACNNLKNMFGAHMVFLIFRRETFLKSIISNKAKVCFPQSTCQEQVIELKV
jgi:hypothetical protein